VVVLTSREQSPISGKKALEIIGTQGAVTIPIGLPGCGKTTFAERLSSAGVIPNDAVISTDTIREALGGRRDWLGDETAVFARAQLLLEARLAMDAICYLDATNLNLERRTRTIELVDKSGRNVLLIRFSGNPVTFRARRLEAGIRYTSAVWAELVSAWQAIDWASIAEPWVDSGAVLSALMENS
jgi:predicted kinase